MKLTILMDNNTLIDRYLTGEPAVSYLLETEGKKILFDTGYSDLFIHNAGKLGKNLADIDFLVLSHGHIDHTGGLDPLLKLLSEGRYPSSGVGDPERKAARRPQLITHPATFNRKYLPGGADIGMSVSREALSHHFDLVLSREPVAITENLLFLGEIERKNTFEAQLPIGKTSAGTAAGGKETDDYLMDDSALVYQAENGLVIITGCSHSGICNIISYAQKVTGVTSIADVVGGFHLLNPPETQLENTLAFFRGVHPLQLHACHCTDLPSKIALSTAAPMEESGTGLVMEYKGALPDEGKRK